MDGPVPAAIEAAEAKGETVLVPQRDWQWCPYFVALAAVRPQLTIQEMPTGFKTLKQKQQEEEKNP